MNEDIGELILERKTKGRLLCFFQILIAFFLIALFIKGGIAAKNSGNMTLIFISGIMIFLLSLLVIFLMLWYKHFFIRIYERGVFLEKGRGLMSIWRGGFYTFEEIKKIVYKPRNVTLMQSSKILFYSDAFLGKICGIDVKNSKEVYDLIIQTRDEYFRTALS
ncbi:MAG: hypothetical protein KKA79_01995 [Nanoarchaeota archaeon]|nr:hypothetical protein [Nanoarchaeota archaeon]